MYGITAGETRCSMDTEKLKRAYGEEYPNAIVLDGVRIPLSRETRFTRSYHSAEQTQTYEFSRFMDGSASLTLAELEREWPRWKERERLEFCHACAWLKDQADFPDMVRFILQNDGAEEWSAIALEAGAALPPNEAFEILHRILSTTEIGRASNITQGIAQTKHPQAEATLRVHLAAVWSHPALWENASFINWVAFDATTCITHLIEIGAPPGDFAEQVRLISEHPCPHNRESCRNFLAKYFAWLHPTN